MCWAGSRSEVEPSRLDGTSRGRWPRPAPRQGSQPDADVRERCGNRHCRVRRPIRQWRLLTGSGTPALEKVESTPLPQRVARRRSSGGRADKVVTEAKVEPVGILEPGKDAVIQGSPCRPPPPSTRMSGRVTPRQRTAVCDNVRAYGDHQPRETRPTPRQFAHPPARRAAHPRSSARVRALREAMDLSLRDLAERCGVSAPMLSQVERGETSPTMQIAGRIAAGLELRLSQLLRLDEHGAVTVVRRDERAQGPAARQRPQLRDPDARRCPDSAPSSRATRSPPAPPPAAPAILRSTSRAAARPRWSSRARWSCACDDRRFELQTGDCVTFDADLPHHFENPGNRPPYCSRS